jgi:hypothetical protein
MFLQGRKHYIFCTLQFFGSTASTVSLCMSAYGLAQNIHEPWAWQNYTITLCIVTTIIVSALKDSLTSNPRIFMTNEELENNPSPPIMRGVV